MPFKPLKRRKRYVKFRAGGYEYLKILLQVPRWMNFLKFDVFG